MNGLITSKMLSPLGLILALFVLSVVVPDTEAGKVRIKDIADFHDTQVSDLIGYGLVIGLDGTGDGSGSEFTRRSLANMMERLGLTVDANQVKVKNIAAVMVTAKLTSAFDAGATFDVTVSSIGDASSLQGGTLLLTPLSTPDGVVRATAQGAVSIGGFNVQVDDGNRIVNNYTLVGRVPSGARVTRPLAAANGSSQLITLALRSPDQVTAYRVAATINRVYGTTAIAQDAASVQLSIPDSLNYPTLRPKFLAEVGQLRIQPDMAAKVVINERTGTIVAGQHVTIAPVAIAHGTITVSIQSRPVISQPGAFSGGETVVTRDPSISVEQELARVVELKESVYLSDVASALNRIGATPRDIVAIFQAMKEAGALRAELVII